MYEFNYHGCDGCHWGIGDWYKEFEEEMRKAIESNEPFDTGYVSCKKEIESFRIERNEDGSFYLHVWGGMDEDEDLVYDAMWDVFRREDEVSKEDMDEIWGYLYDNWDFKTESVCGCDYSFGNVNGTAMKISGLKKALYQQMDVVQKDLDDSYNYCKSIVKEYFTNKYGWEAREN